MAFKIMFHKAIKFLNQKYVIVFFNPRFLFLSFFALNFSYLSLLISCFNFYQFFIAYVSRTCAKCRQHYYCHKVVPPY